MKTVAIFVVLCNMLIACSETNGAKSSTQKTPISQAKKEESVTSTSDPTPKLQSNQLSSSEIKKQNQEIQSLKQNGKLTHYEYPSMSRCGGALDGFYLGNELILISSTYGGEMGQSSKNINWKNNQPIKIEYREQWADWEKYNKKYPKETEFDEKKMFYTDTLYTIELGKTWKFQKSAGRKTVSTIIDSALVNRLIICAFSMKEELETVKKIVK